MIETDNIALRIADERDVDAIVEFNCGIALETENIELNKSILRPGVEGLLKNKQYGFYVVAEDAQNGKKAGGLMITYEWSDWRNGLIWWVQSVYIMPDYRRRGIYRRLYAFVKDMAVNEKNVRGFRLYVDKDNLAAQQTYSQLGMKESHYIMFEDVSEE